MVSFLLEMLQFPTATARALLLIGWIGASNVRPGQIAATADLLSDEPFRVEYVAHSARAYSNFYPEDFRCLAILSRIKARWLDRRASTGDLLPSSGGTVIVTLELRVLK